MPRRRTRVPFLDFVGGLNEDDHPGALAQNELRIARNVYWEGRALASRKGADRIQTSAVNSAAAGTGVYEFVRAGGTSRDLIAVFGNKIYSGAKAASPTDITGAITITAGAANQCEFASFNDVMLVANGVDAVWKWTGSGNCAVVAGSPPIFKTILSKWNRVFGAGHTAARTTIRHSALGDYETWAAGDTVGATTSDTTGAIEGRDWITQLGHLGDVMFVGMANAIGRADYTGDSTVPFRYQQIAEFGCEPRSYVSVGNDGYFLSKYGVHYVTPSDVFLKFEASLVSGRKLRTFWSNLNRNRIQYTTGTLARASTGNLLICWPLSTSGASAHDVCLVMDVTDGPGQERFAYWTGWDANAMAAVRNASSLVEELLFVSTVGFVWQGDTGTDDEGSAYVVEAATRWEDFGLPAQKKNLRDMYIETKQSGTHALNIDVIFDYATTPTLTSTVTLTGTAQAAWGTAVWGTATWPTLGFIREYLYGVDDGVVMSFRFYTDGANEPWSLFKFVPAVRALAESEEAA